MNMIVHNERWETLQAELALIAQQLGPENGGRVFNVAATLSSELGAIEQSFTHNHNLPLVFEKLEADDPLKRIAGEIMRVFDFADNVTNSIALDNARAPELQVELATEFIDQIHEAGVWLMDGFADFVETGKPTLEAKEKVAIAIRSLFAQATDLQDVLEKLPTGAEGGKMEIDPSILAIKETEDHGVLPTQKELGVGDVRVRWEGLMESHPWAANLARACEMACTQVFRINYRFAEEDIGLVDNPQHLQPGRVVIDTKIQAMREREKALERKARDLTQMTSHVDLIGRS